MTRQLVVGEELSTKELLVFLGYSSRTWNSGGGQKEYILSVFEDHYDYIVEQRWRTNYYIITGIKHHYEGRVKLTSKQKREYERKIEEIIKQDNVQTASNICRIILQDESFKVYHKEYLFIKIIRDLMKEKFGTYKDRTASPGNSGRINRKVWVTFLSPIEYRELTKEELDFLFSYNDKELHQEQAELTEQYMSKEITKDEFLNKLGDNRVSFYGQLKNNFVREYGFTPFLANEYELSAFYVKV